MYKKLRHLFTIIILICIVCPNNYYGEMCLHRCMCNATTEICDSHRGCICDISRTNNKCVTTLQLDTSSDTRTWILDMSIILSFLIMSIICAVLLIICYFYYYRHQMYKSKRLIKNNFELQTCADPEEKVNIAVINNGKICHCDKKMGNPAVDLENSNSFTNKSFFIEYAGNHHHGYDTNEHIYYEISENTSEHAEDLYDHLDFLRPTGSWKPHYQNKSALQEKNSDSTFRSNAEENT